MKRLNCYIKEAFKLTADTKINKMQEYHYHPKTRGELKELVEKLIEERGNNADLNDIDTSDITDMHNIFGYSKFNGDISQWDVSNVTDMSSMFAYSKFNGDISLWDVSNVKDMYCMFYDSKFNGDISKWDVNNVKYHMGMFDQCSISNQSEKHPKFKISQ